jgi:hypothetical protein
MGRDESRLYETACQEAEPLAIRRWVWSLPLPVSFTLKEGR